MNIRSAEFIKGINSGEDEIFADPLPKIAFIGRSNVGKSSLINTLTGRGIARTSPEPGHTRQINVYLINKQYHLIDLPGYGFARGSLHDRALMSNLIASYLLNPKYEQKKIVLIIDAVVGMTDKDISIFNELAHYPKDFVVAASKVDKLTQSERYHNLKAIQLIAGAHKVFPFSSKNKTGIDELAAELFS